jgi:hypothetical protein
MWPISGLEENRGKELKVGIRTNAAFSLKYQPIGSVTIST